MEFLDLSLVQIGLIILFVLFMLLGVGVWIGVSLLAAGWFGVAFFSNAPAIKAMATAVWASSSSWSLAALPLFIWMGEILFRTKLSENMFRGLAPWVGWLPGRLLHVNVIGCGIFAAVSGSSAATVATIGKMSLPELERRGYDRDMSIGSLAGSGTLGLLIPPSIIMIVYGVAAEVSLVRLFIAGIGPGLLIICLFSGFIGVSALINRKIVPANEQIFSWSERFSSISELVPVLLLIVAVIGSIYSGLATATEAAAGGVIGALLVSKISGTLNWENFRVSLMGATRLSCMICFILAGASFLSTAMAYTGVPRALAQWVVEMDMNPYLLIGSLCLLYTIMGCFIDGISMIVLTTSIVLPIITAAGFDLIWFGIFIIIVVEISQVTPPLGFNLFVIQGMTKQEIFSVARSTFPFFLLLVVAVAIITVFPEIAIWLPSRILEH
ncbi:MAG: TRAP transporter large permease subunit [Alphaproteobacteria bacterium]|nr:TRAP transporter large permease subunit [Alphaproteobacteria bacterium]